MAPARNWILALLLAIAAGGALAACSSSGEGRDTPLEPASPTSETTGFDRPSGSHGLSNN